MRTFASLLIFVILIGFNSCEKGVEITGGETRDVLGLSNWTGHWDEICSTGRTLTFVVTVGDATEEHTILKDSGSSFKGEINEGDLVSVQILNEMGNVLLSRQKTFTPSDPEQVAPTLDGEGTYVQVCDIGILEFYGF